jgi:ribosome-associated protein
MLIVNDFIAIPERELDFQFSRSSGPGGQNVNKVNSKALLYWQPRVGHGIGEAMLARFQSRFASRINAEGYFFISSDRHRDRLQNQEDCCQKLRECLLAVVAEPKLRKKKQPSFSSKVRRKENKRIRGKTKASRRKVDRSEV